MYGKLFTSMYDGTLGTEGPWQALVTFQQMVILADREGVVDMTSGALARRTNIPLEIIEAGIEALLKPDPKSRSEAEEGRRIVPLEDHRDWGWRLVNYEHYRKIRSAEERREYLRVAQQRRRDKLKHEPSTNVNTSTANTQNQPIVEVEVEVKEVEQERSAKASPDLSPIVESLPLRDGRPFPIKQSVVSEFEIAYPRVDVLVTLKEMRAWLIANPDRRKTQRGCLRFVNTWLSNAQREYEANG